MTYDHDLLVRVQQGRRRRSRRQSSADGRGHTRPAVAVGFLHTWVRSNAHMSHDRTRPAK